MDTPIVRPIPPLTRLKELARRSEHDATLLVSDGADRVFVQKLVPAETANPEVWDALSRTSHPALVRVWQVDREPWGLSVLMDYVPGPTLEQVVEAQGALAPKDVVPLIGQVAQGAAELHRLGIVHRDLSCANVVVGPLGACIIDAGIARRPGPDTKRHDTVVLGTRGFAAPEQYGFAETDPRTDVYALGRLAAFLLTGLSPASPICEEALDDPAVVPAPLRRVIERACSLSPADRPATALDFARNLERAVGEGSAEAHRPERPTASPAGHDGRDRRPTAQGTIHPSPAGTPRGGGAPPAWRRRLATAAAVVGALFCALMACGLLMTPSHPGMGKPLWDFQCLSIGVCMGLVPGLLTRWFLRGERRFSTARHPAVLWVALLGACFVATLLLVGISSALFEG